MTIDARMPTAPIAPVVKSVEVACAPGRSVAFTWHPGLPVEESTDVVVRFAPTAHGTRVELVHTGWERWEDPVSQRDDYDAGWVPVLARFADRASVPDPESPEGRAIP